MKKTFVRLSPESLASLLSLPRGSRVTHVTYDPLRDSYVVSVEGAGWETPEGSHLMQAAPQYSYQLTGWDLPPDN